MSYKDVLVFDISSEYGHFRKFNTTTSPLTYSVPTRPAIAGLIGSILGIEREIAANKFREGATPLLELLSQKNASIGVQLLNPVKKVNIGFNLLSTKNFRDYYNIHDKDTTGSIKDAYRRTQIEFELLKNPAFRIFISWQNTTLFNELISRIKNNQTHFTPYLGLSQFTAIVKFVNVVRADLLESDMHEDVLTALNLSKITHNNQVVFDYESAKYTSDTMPVEMQPDRTVTDYAEILIETNGKPIRVKLAEIYNLENFGKISFL